MNILQISAGPNPLGDSANNYLDALPEALASRGHHVTVLHMAEAGSPLKGFQITRRKGIVSTVSIWNSGAYASVPPGRGGIGVAQPRKDIVPSARLRRAFAEILDESQPDVVHVQNLFGLPIRILDEAAKRGIPVAMTEHAFYPICPTAHLLLENGQPCSFGRDSLICHRCSRRSLTYPMFRLNRALAILAERAKDHAFVCRSLSFLKRAMNSFSWWLRPMWHSRKGYVERYDAMCEMMRKLDMLHCISDMQAERLQNAIGRLPNVVVRPIVPPTIRRVGPVARETTGTGKATFLVMNVFPWRDDKGWSYLQRVIARLEEQRRDFRVLWYADAETSHHQIEYRGRYRSGELDSMAAAADACIMPSICQETLGFTGMEMLSRGVPLICSDRCGVSQFVTHGVSGMIFDPSTEEGLYSILIGLLDNPAKLAAMRRAQAEACLQMQTYDEHVDEFSGMLEALTS